jgi:hypothetical protein
MMKRKRTETTGKRNGHSSGTKLHASSVCVLHAGMLCHDRFCQVCTDEEANRTLTYIRCTRACISHVSCASYLYSYDGPNDEPPCEMTFAGRCGAVRTE